MFEETRIPSRHGDRSCRTSLSVIRFVGESGSMVHYNANLVDQVNSLDEENLRHCLGTSGHVVMLGLGMINYNTKMLQKKKV